MNTTKLIVTLGIIFTIGLAHAAPVGTHGKVKRIAQVGNGLWGNCLVNLEIIEGQQRPANHCPGDGDWISLTCDGSVNPKDVAYRMLDASQMAMALNKVVYVEFDNAVIINGVCVAHRFDVID